VYKRLVDDVDDDDDDDDVEHCDNGIKYGPRQIKPLGGEWRSHVQTI
jgi:hypothetical protein